MQHRGTHLPTFIHSSVNVFSWSKSLSVNVLICLYFKNRTDYVCQKLSWTGTNKNNNGGSGWDWSTFLHELVGLVSAGGSGKKINPAHTSGKKFYHGPNLILLIPCNHDGDHK